MRIWTLVMPECFIALKRGLAAIVIVPLLLLAIGMCPAMLNGLDKAEIADLFSRGKAFFRQANDLVSTNPEQAKAQYQKAVLYFQRIVREGGVENGKLYYNIGNAYFRMGDVGRAILNYRRAERFIPNDPNLRQNLSYARSRRLDQVEEKAQVKVLKIFFFWHYDLNCVARFVLLLIFFDVVWICAGIYLFVKKAALSYAILAGAILSILLVGSLGIESYQESRICPGVIIAKEVTARKGDSKTYQSSFKEPLHAGTEFNLVQDRNHWYHIELTGARRCWIPDSAAKLVRAGTSLF